MTAKAFNTESSVDLGQGVHLNGALGTNLNANATLNAVNFSKMRA